MGHREKAVLVVDMQKDNVGRYCSDIIPKISLLLGECRRKDLPIFFAIDTRRREDGIFDRLNMEPHAIKGTEGWEIIGELMPAEGDQVIEKPMLSAFFSSDLDFRLGEGGIKELVVCGVRTEGCILKTVLDAFELGYDVTVPSDCIASPSRENHESALKIFDYLKINTDRVDEFIETL